MERRRIPGPDASTPPIVQKTPQIQIPSDAKNKILRNDGRTLESLRPIFLKTGLISQANGSAYMEIDSTKVSCGVYGPRQTKTRTGFSGKGTLNCEFKFSTFACPKRRGFLRDNQERDLSVIVSEALAPSVRLELLPKSTIDIYITVLQSDGIAACLAAAIACASVALADAGVEMVDMVPACSASYINSLIYLDSTAEEEKIEDASMMVAYMPSLNEATHILQTGELDLSLIMRGTEQCMDACSKIYAVMSAALVEGMKNRTS